MCLVFEWNLLEKVEAQNVSDLVCILATVEILVGEASLSGTYLGHI